MTVYLVKKTKRRLLNVIALFQIKKLFRAAHPLVSSTYTLHRKIHQYSLYKKIFVTNFIFIKSSIETIYGELNLDYDYDKLGKKHQSAKVELSCFFVLTASMTNNTSI